MPDVDIQNRISGIVTLLNWHTSTSQRRNVRGSRSGPMPNATRALARSTGASHRAKSPTSRHARNHARMTRSARASPSLTAGGAAISVLIARTPSRQARQFPCGWALSERLRQLQKLQVSLLVWTLCMEAAYHIIGRLALVETLRIIARNEVFA